MTHAFDRDSHARAVLGRLLWQALVVGLLVWAAFPALRQSGQFGPGGLWLLALPASSLLAFHRARLAAWWPARVADRTVVARRRPVPGRGAARLASPRPRRLPAPARAA